MRDWLRHVLQILEEHGVKDFEIQKGKKHPKLCFEHGGKEHRLVFPSSASDHRALLNHKADLRRVLKQGTL